MEISKQKTVVVALSGGVDSAVAALLLKKQGYRVIGAFLKCFSDTKDPLTGECSYLQDKRDSQKVAIHLNIPWVIFDFEKEYKKQVIKPMYQAYATGLTPNPDMACNSIIKFPLLWREAKKLGAEHIATGHYACIKHTKQGYQLLANKDKTKDQSYFLAELTQNELSHTLFPLGQLTKKEVRQIAKKAGLFNWKKRGTRGVCFVGKVPMQQFLKKVIKPQQGKVITPKGDELGTHNGISYYTIGQKVGEHIGIRIQKPREEAQRRFYVAEKKKPNTLIVAPEGHPALAKKEIIIKKLHIINTKEKLHHALKARIRHLGLFHAGNLIKKSGKCHFVFNRAVQAIAEGQYAVLYYKNRVVGSGEIRLE